MKKILLLVLVFSNAVFPNDSFEATGDKSSDFIFKEDDINGSGGGLFFQYGYNISDEVSHLYWGGRFYFQFKKNWRLGAYAGLVRPLGEAEQSGYFVGALASYLFRFDPLILGIPIVLGQSGYNDHSYFTIYPQVELELRITSSFSLSILAGYLFLLNEATFIGNRMPWHMSQPTIGATFNFSSF